MPTYYTGGKVWSDSPSRRSSSNSRGKVQAAKKAATMQDFQKAKREADERKRLHAETLRARGGVPVSAKEKTDLAYKQMARGGVGVAQSKTPTTIVDRDGTRTTITQRNVMQAQRDYYSPSSGSYRQTRNIREYGTSQKPVPVQMTPQQRAVDNARRFSPVMNQVLFSSAMINRINEKDLNTRNTSLSQNDTRISSRYNLDNYRISGRNFDDKVPKENQSTPQKSFISRFGSRIGERTVFPVARGLEKGALTFKEIISLEDIKKTRQAFIESKTDKNKGLQTLKETKLKVTSRPTIGNDPDVRAAGIAAGFGVAGVAAPAVTGLTVATISVASGVKTVPKAIKSKTPEDIADAIIDVVGVTGAAGAVSKGVRASSFVGKEFVPAESITAPKVLSGKTRFPVMKDYKAGMGGELLPEFKTGKYQLGSEGGFHASPSPLKGSTVGAGTSETAGLYIAPELSPHFLKINGEGAIKLSILPKNAKPTIQYFDVPVERIPSGIRKQGFGAMQDYMGTPKSVGAGKTPSVSGSGTARISPQFEAGLKAEKEAIIPFQSELKPVRLKGFWNKITGFEEYTVIEGTKVPIRKYTTTTQPTAKTNIQRTAGMKKINREMRLTESYRSGEKYLSVSELIPSGSPGSSSPDSSMGKLKRTTSSSVSSVISKKRYSSLTSSVTPKVSSKSLSTSKKSVSRSRVSSKNSKVSEPKIPKSYKQPPRPPKGSSSLYRSESTKVPDYYFRESSSVASAPSAAYSFKIPPVIPKKMGGLDVGVARPKGKPKKKSDKLFGYDPSLSALYFGYKGGEKGMTVGGIGIRPIGRKTKRKKVITIRLK